MEGKIYTQTFGNPNGYRVLKDLINNFDSSELFEGEDHHISIGRRQVIDFIKRKLKQECGKDKNIYADILYEVELL